MRTRAFVLYTFGFVFALAAIAFGWVGRSGPDSQGISASAQKRLALSRQLLLRSYEQSKDFAPEERIIYLSMASRVASHMDSRLARDWSEELFKTSLQIPMSWSRVAAEKNAAVSLSAFDPSRAMEILLAMDTELPTNGGPPPEDLRADAAESIFAAIWKKQGAAAIPGIRACAAHIAEHGQYPYIAMAPLVTEISAHDPGMARALFSEAVSYYKRGSSVVSADLEFVNFLLETQHAVPWSLLKEGVTAFLGTEHPDSNNKSKYLTRVRTDNGSAEFHDRTDELIFELLPVIRKADAPLEASILRDHPALVPVENQAGTVEFSESVVAGTDGSQDNVSGAMAQGIQRSRLAGIQEMAATNPSEALELALSISDPGARAVALAEVASGYSSQDIDKAKDAFSQAKATVEKLSDDDPNKISGLSALVSAAASLHDSELFKHYLDRLLSVGEEAFKEDADEHPGKTAVQLDGFSALSNAIEAAAAFAPEPTASAVNGVSDSRLETYLLVSAAEGMQK